MAAAKKASPKKASPRKAATVGTRQRSTRIKDLAAAAKKAAKEAPAEANTKKKRETAAKPKKAASKKVTAGRVEKKASPKKASPKKAAPKKKTSPAKKPAAKKGAAKKACSGEGTEEKEACSGEKPSPVKGGSLPPFSGGKFSGGRCGVKPRGGKYKAPGCFVGKWGQSDSSNSPDAEKTAKMTGGKRQKSVSVVDQVADVCGDFVEKVGKTVKKGVEMCGLSPEPKVREAAPGSTSPH